DRIDRARGSRRPQDIRGRQALDPHLAVEERLWFAEQHLGSSELYLALGQAQGHSWGVAAHSEVDTVGPRLQGWRFWFARRGGHREGGVAFDIRARAAFPARDLLDRIFFLEAPAGQRCHLSAAYGHLADPVRRLLIAKPERDAEEMSSWFLLAHG